MVGRLVFGVSAALLFAFGSPASVAPTGSPNAERPDVVSVKGDDAEMEAAKAKGRSTLPIFYQRLAAPAGDEGDFAIKFNLTPNGDVEFIWAGELQFDSKGKLSGVLHNVPIDTRFQQGQRVAIDQAEIIDWGYRKGAIIQGNHTTRVILGRMPADQAAAVRSSLGW